jgi:hypothetical protein
VSQDQAITAWIRKAEILAEQLMVDPSEVYDALVQRGYTGRKPRNSLPVDTSVALISSLFSAEEILTISEVTSRYLKQKSQPIRTTNPNRYIRVVLARNSNENGKRRFRRVKAGAYRLILSNAELRLALLKELEAQRVFVGSRRLMEMFDISYERLKEALGPMAQRNLVTSRPNSTTKSRDWCLTKYAEVFGR